MSNTQQELSLSGSVQTPQVANTPTEEVAKPTFMKYALTAVLVVLVCYLIFYAYEKYKKNSESTDESLTNKKKKEEIVADFDLEDAISTLESMQKRTLSKVSSNSSI